MWDAKDEQTVSVTIKNLIKLPTHYQSSAINNLSKQKLKFNCCEPGDIEKKKNYYYYLPKPLEIVCFFFFLLL